jgi:hypothetical protein
MNTKIVRMNGVPVRVPSDQLTDPDPWRAEDCGAREPEWPDGMGGQVVCTLPPHARPDGPDGVAHMANNAASDIIAIWWDVPAVWNVDDDN